MRVYLAEWREAEGNKRGKEITQAELGQRIEPAVDKGTVSRWENAKPGHLSLGVIAAYAEALGRPVQDMYRNPSEGPSLDGIASGLEPDLREKAVDVVTALARRKAS